MKHTNIYDVDVFQLVRVSLKGIRADSATAAAQVANNVDLTQVVGRIGSSAPSSVVLGQQFAVGDVEPQDLNGEYYGVYPIDEVTGDPADEPHEVNWSFRPAMPGKAAAGMERDLLTQVLRAIDPHSLTFDPKFLAILTDAAKATGEPLPVYVDRGEEVASMPRNKCPDDETYEQWVNRELGHRYRSKEQFLMVDDPQKPPF